MKIKISSPLQLSAHFKSLRRSKGWSQSDLGARLGITQSRVAQIESNPEAISVDRLIQVLHVLDAGLFLQVEQTTDKATKLFNKISKVNLDVKNHKNLSISQAKNKHTQDNSPSTHRQSSSGRFLAKTTQVKNPKNTKW